MLLCLACFDLQMKGKQGWKCGIATQDQTFFQPKNVFLKGFFLSVNQCLRTLSNYTHNKSLQNLHFGRTFKANGFNKDGRFLNVWKNCVTSYQNLATKIHSRNLLLKVNCLVYVISLLWQNSLFSITGFVTCVATRAGSFEAFANIQIIVVVTSSLWY